MFTLNQEDFHNFDLNNVQNFIQFWEQYYNYTSPNILGLNARIDYATELNIGNPLTIENIIRLLRWKDPRLLTHKNGNNIKNPKVNGVLNRIQDLNEFRGGRLTEARFRTITGEIFPNGHVWRVFLFHICKPIQYPIIDRYVKLAFNCHVSNNIFDDAWTLEDAWDQYMNYVGYFINIYNALNNNAPPPNNVEGVQALKRVDNALMAYGQFLEKYGL